MRIFRDFRRRRVVDACVASIGNFDGVHLGHQSIIESLVGRAVHLHLPVAIVTFEPHPLEYFARDRAPPRLMKFRQKVEALSRHDVDIVGCLRFDGDFASTPAHAFVEDYLVGGLGVRHLVVGDDFHFGKDRKGDFSLLNDLGRRLGFDTERAPTCIADGERVSSSRIRTCIANGDFATAKRLLGRPYSVTGKVTYGERKGREFGFPTINVSMRQTTTPLSGIFAVVVHGLGESVLPGAAYVGTRPAVNGQTLVLEVHLLGFQGDVYGARVEVEFLAKIRGDRHFDDIEELVAQMHRDVADVKQFFRPPTA